MMNEGQYQIVCGDGASMAILRDGEADMVLTSPPYFSMETGCLLRRRARGPADLERVRCEIVAHADGLRGVYAEIRRVMRPGGVLALQVKDIHYGGVLIPLASQHRQIAEETGLRLVARVFRRTCNRRYSAGAFLKNPRVGQFRSDEVEELLILSDPASMSRDRGGRPRVDLPDEEIRKCCSPVWTVPPAGRLSVHPHPSPPALVGRLVALYTEPGELVVDPFAGSGTTLKVAASMGRRAVGYETDPDYVNLANAPAARPVGLSSGNR